MKTVPGCTPEAAKRSAGNGLLHVVLLSVTLAGGGALRAQEWAEKTVQLPYAVSGHAMAYDSVRQRTVLFGGLQRGRWGGGVFDETLEWDGGRWVEYHLPLSPPARGDHAMAYNRAQGEVILFGGRQGFTGAALADTWAWNGTNWQLRSPAQSPSDRLGHAMAYDEARRRVVLFGGESAGLPLADTWTWDGADWTRLAPSQSPPARRGCALAYDRAAGRVVLFGGESGGAPLADTWTWDGANWVQMLPVQSPPARQEHTLVYHAVRQATVLFGGLDAAGLPVGDSWEWDGRHWMQALPLQSPGARFGHAMAYDSVRGRAVLYGGVGRSSGSHNDTWVYGPFLPASTQTYGSGCAAPTGAAYIGPPNGEAGGPVGDYVYRLTFDLSGFDPASATITGRWSTDNSALLDLNGARTGISKSDLGYRTLDAFTIRTGFVAGINTLDFRVTNSGGPTGFAVVDLQGVAQRNGQQDPIPGLFATGVDARGMSLGAGSPEIHYALTRGPAGPPTALTPHPAWAPPPGFSQPALSASGRPSFGNPAFSLRIDAATALAPAVLLLSGGATQTQIGRGCDLLVDLTTPTFAVHLSIDGSGVANLGLPVPSNQALAGLSVYAQAFVATPNGPFTGMTLSNGLQITVGE